MLQMVAASIDHFLVVPPVLAICPETLFQRKFLSGKRGFSRRQISACATGDLFLIKRSPRAVNLGARFDFYGEVEEKSRSHKAKKPAAHKPAKPARRR